MSRTACGKRGKRDVKNRIKKGGELSVKRGSFVRNLSVTVKKCGKLILFLSTTRPQQRNFPLSDRGRIKSKKIPETLINKGFGSFFVVRVTGLEPAAS